MQTRLAFITGCFVLASGCLDGDIGNGSYQVGTFPGPEGWITARYESIGDSALVGGDMVFSLEERVVVGVFQIEGFTKRWPNGVIPYELSPGYRYSEMFEHGVNAWNAVSDRTGVTFVKRNSEVHYLAIVETSRGQTCTSSIGKAGGRQELALSPPCTENDATHELGHAIGLIHEMSRPDRDLYISMNWGNIPEDSRGAWGAIGGPTKARGPYDLKSIMHYPALGPDGKLRFTGLHESERLATYTTISELDIEGVAAMYEGRSSSGSCEIDCQDMSMRAGDCILDRRGSFQCMDTGCIEEVSACPTIEGRCEIGGQVGVCFSAAETLCFAPSSPSASCGGGACCLPDSFRCHESGNVISLHEVCDGNADCPDSEDEPENCSLSPEPEPEPEPNWGACDVGGQTGQCIDTSIASCNGQLFTGYCPGTSEILCCVGG